MVQVEDKIVSFDIFEKQFVCDLSACKGACCVDGDAGAPLTDEELDVLSKIFDEDTSSISFFFLSKTPSTFVINNNLLDFKAFATAIAAVSPLIL